MIAVVLAAMAVVFAPSAAVARAVSSAMAVAFTPSAAVARAVSSAMAVAFVLVLEKLSFTLPTTALKLLLTSWATAGVPVVNVFGMVRFDAKLAMLLDANRTATLAEISDFFKVESSFLKFQGVGNEKLINGWQSQDQLS